MNNSVVKNVAPSSSSKQGSASTGSTSMTSVKSPVPTDSVNGYRLPDNITMQHAIRLSIVEDKPIMMDYWVSSLDKSVLIGVKENQEKLLVKDAEQYTSPVSKIYKVASEYIVMTENSIYLVDVNIPTKRISA